MPIYEYEHTEGSRVCPVKFEVNRPLNAPPLTVCPVCKKPVRRVYGGFYMPNHL
ncbi:MAG TPA: FmdB family transcriptional regulator, partial [Verrucomicrobiales bacterium]|nr:FmdB family transcriptional regulator [Verrucomicrobiales bacterium]